MDTIKTGAYLFLAILTGFGIINLPELWLGVSDDIEYKLSDPHKMILQISGVESKTEYSFFGSYEGYTTKATLVNTGSSGFVTIVCDAINNKGNVIAKKEHTFHVDRNSQNELLFIFTKELSEHEIYSFKVTVINSNIDS